MKLLSRQYHFHQSVDSKYVFPYREKNTQKGKLLIFTKLQCISLRIPKLKLLLFSEKIWFYTHLVLDMRLCKQKRKKSLTFPAIFLGDGTLSNVFSNLYKDRQKFPTSASTTSGSSPLIGPSIQSLYRKLKSKVIVKNV